VFADKRLANYPDVPTATELGYPVKTTVWGGLIAPRGLPALVRGRLEAACAKAVNNDAYKRQAERLNTPLVYRDSAAFESIAAAEARSYGTLIRNAGLADR
jgi:tripartite-type tricarboxylate transporter receptor subunit TctC